MLSKGLRFPPAAALGHSPPLGILARMQRQLDIRPVAHELWPD
jgi:hypothetical protein